VVPISRTRFLSVLLDEGNIPIEARKRDLRIVWQDLGRGSIDLFFVKEQKIAIPGPFLVCLQPERLDRQHHGPAWGGSQRSRGRLSQVQQIGSDHLGFGSQDEGEGSERSLLGGRKWGVTLVKIVMRCLACT